MCERLKKNKNNVARIIYFMLDVRTAFVIKLKNIFRHPCTFLFKDEELAQVLLYGVIPSRCHSSSFGRIISKLLCRRSLLAAS